MHAQPTVDRSPFRKHGLSLAPLQQAVKSLASHEIKQRPGERANRRWEGPPPPPEAMAKEERVNGYSCFWHIWQQSIEEHGMPSMVCQRQLCQARSIVSSANTATVPWHPP